MTKKQLILEINKVINEIKGAKHFINFVKKSNNYTDNLDFFKTKNDYLSFFYYVLKEAFIEANFEKESLAIQKYFPNVPDYVKSQIGFTTDEQGAKLAKYAKWDVLNIIDIANEYLINQGITWNYDKVKNLVEKMIS